MSNLVTWPNALTSGNLSAGFLALIAVQSHLRLALALVILAALLDSMDGFLARRNGIEGAFGANLDSLSDLVSFGLVPAMGLYVARLHTVPVLGIAVCLGFALCGGWRLARFPLVKSCHSFVGLPIPPAGIGMLALAIWGPSLPLTILAACALGALMVSAFPFPTISALGRGAAFVQTHAPRRRFSGDA